MNEIRFRGTRQELRRLLNAFVGSLSGRTGAYAPYVRGIKQRIGMVALASIQEAFIAKAAGGVGEDGITWTPLKKQTVANRRLGPGDKGLMKGYGAHNGRDVLGRIKRGFLTPAQDERWRKIFGSRKAEFINRHGMGDAEAAAHAAQIAWATLKSEGAKTKLEVLGNRHVQIGRDTGRLFNSLSPGTNDPESHALLAPAPEAPEPADRVLREEPGAIVVGSNVVYAGRFHAQRPLWPADGLPAAWADRIADAARSGIEEAIEMILATQTQRQGVA